MAKSVGWRQQPARHALAAKGISSGNRRVLRKAAITPLIPELTTVQVAENAIRDMFLSRQYHGKVSNEDIEIMLNSPRWHSIYGKKELRKTWDVLIEDGYIHQEGNHWFWGID